MAWTPRARVWCTRLDSFRSSGACIGKKKATVSHSRVSICSRFPVFANQSDFPRPIFSAATEGGMKQSLLSFGGTKKIIGSTPYHCEVCGTYHKTSSALAAHKRLSSEHKEREHLIKMTLKTAMPPPSTVAPATPGAPPLSSTSSAVAPATSSGDHHRPRAQCGSLQQLHPDAQLHQLQRMMVKGISYSLFSRSFHAISLQFPRSSHAVPTQFPRSSHAIPTQFPMQLPSSI